MEHREKRQLPESLLQTHTVSLKFGQYFTLSPTQFIFCLFHFLQATGSRVGAERLDHVSEHRGGGCSLGR